MNTNTAIQTGTHERPAPEGAEDRKALEQYRMLNEENREKVKCFLATLAASQYIL